MIVGLECQVHQGEGRFLNLLKDLRHSSLAKDALGQKLLGEKYKAVVKKIALAMIERGKVGMSTTKLRQY